MSAVLEEGKPKAEVLEVTMEDGRKVSFGGKSKMKKSILIDDSKVTVDGDLVQLEAGAVKLRVDFRNGATRTYSPPVSLYAQFLGHGASQKYGDEVASTSGDPMTEEDMVIAMDDLDSTIQTGSWGRTRAEGGGGVSGAGIVVRAIMEATGKDVNAVKAYLQKRLDGDKELTRKALYNSFRSPNAATYAIIKRMEEEKLAKAPAVDASAALKELGAA